MKMHFLKVNLEKSWKKYTRDGFGFYFLKVMHDVFLKDSSFFTSSWNTSKYNLK